MIYGLYLSATGVLSSSNRQDVIANNLANVETVGFKRNIALAREQRTESALRGGGGLSNALLEGLGGGVGGAPTATDWSQGDIEPSSSPTDIALHGKGFFAVRAGRETMLTRDGRFVVDRNGFLVGANSGHQVLDDQLQPITIGTGKFAVNKSGEITTDGRPAATLGVFDVSDPLRLVKRGGNLFASSGLEKQLRPASAEVQGSAVERGNADPALELAQLMDAQRQLEANANMIRYQDQTLGKLVNEVGKIG